MVDLKFDRKILTFMAGPELEPYFPVFERFRCLNGDFFFRTSSPPVGFLNFKVLFPSSPNCNIFYKFPVWSTNFHASRWEYNSSTRNNGCTITEHRPARCVVPCVFVLLQSGLRAKKENEKEQKKLPQSTDLQCLLSKS